MKSNRWRCVPVLRQIGLRPLLVEKVLGRAGCERGGLPPDSLAEEMTLVRSALNSFWRPCTAPPAQDQACMHVFIGPPASGKTTVLCKWLARHVLGEGGKARAWRLDSRAAHLPGLLDCYAEILGVPVEREWLRCRRGDGFSSAAGASGMGPRAATGEGANGTDCWRQAPPAQAEVGFVDLPGVSLGDRAAFNHLRFQLQSFSEAHLHVVLNAAYDASLLLAQVRAFSSLKQADLVFTHLDEEKRLGKLWNVVLDSSLPIRFLSAGQDIPGELRRATPELLLAPGAGGLRSPFRPEKTHIRLHRAALFQKSESA
jgi:SRP54-type protein, GTPase domain